MKLTAYIACATMTRAEVYQLFGLGIPGVQSVGRVADTVGLGASAILRGMHQQILDLTSPIDAARVDAINKRDAALQDHLDFMESAYKPVQNLASLTGAGLNRITSGIDVVAGSILRPVTDTAKFLGRFEKAGLDIGQNAIGLGLISDATR